VADLVPADGSDVRMLGFDDALPWKRSSDGIEITLPDQPAASPAPVFRIEGLT
jgi:hypothetical protein